MLDKTYRGYMDLIKAKVWTKSDVLRVRKALNAVRFKPDTKDKMSSWLFEFNFEGKHYRLTPEHTKQGIEYLRRYTWTTNGNPRKGCVFGYRERAIISEFKRFAFIGFRPIEYGYGGKDYKIVYRVYAKNGSYFDYTPNHWGHPEVVS